MRYLAPRSEPKLALTLACSSWEWIGLAFLLKHVAGNLGEIAALVGPSVKLAWDAADKPPHERGILIDSAARGLAQAIAKLFRLILEAIVMILLAKGAAKLGELTGKLKASKLERLRRVGRAELAEAGGRPEGLIRDSGQSRVPASDLTQWKTCLQRPRRTMLPSTKA